MYDTSQPFEYPLVSAAQRQAVMGNVLRLLGVAFLCTAIGALLGVRIGMAAFLISIVGSIGTLIALFLAREKSPANLWLLYAFATFEGMALGLILESYFRLGLGGAVLNAAATTGVVTLVAGTYGATTKRDLTKLGSILTIGLIVLVVASLIGFFLGSTGFQLLLAMGAAVLFTGFLVFDLNRVANAQGATQGQTILLTVGVYLDIFNLFLALLRIFGVFSSRDD